MGTHPIFESDFDCLTDQSVACTVMVGGDIAKTVEDLLPTLFPSEFSKSLEAADKNTIKNLVEMANQNKNFEKILRAVEISWESNLNPETNVSQLDPNQNQSCDKPNSKFDISKIQDKSSTGSIISQELSDQTMARDKKTDISRSENKNEIAASSSKAQNTPIPSIQKDIKTSISDSDNEKPEDKKPRKRRPSMRKPPIVKLEMLTESSSDSTDIEDF